MPPPLWGTIYRPPYKNYFYHGNILNEIQRAKDFSEHVVVLADLNYDCCKNKHVCIFEIESLLDMK